MAKHRSLPFDLKPRRGDAHSRPAGGWIADSRPHFGSVAQQAGRYYTGHIVDQIQGKSAKPLEYFDKGIMAMIGPQRCGGRGGRGPPPTDRPDCFRRWLGVHAALPTTTSAKVGSVMDWALDYFGQMRCEQILDLPSGHAFDWGKDEEQEPAAPHHWRRSEPAQD